MLRTKSNSPRKRDDCEMGLAINKKYMLKMLALKTPTELNKNNNSRSNVMSTLPRHTCEITHMSFTLIYS